MLSRRTTFGVRTELRPEEPRRELKRRPHLSLSYRDDLPLEVRGGFCRVEGVGVVVLRAGMGQDEERFVLAHELAHDDVSAGDYVEAICSPADPRVHKAERQCDLRACRYLVPSKALRCLIREIRCTGEESPHVWAEELGIPVAKLLFWLAEVGKHIGPIPAWWQDERWRPRAPLSSVA